MARSLGKLSQASDPSTQDTFSPYEQGPEESIKLVAVV